MAYMKVHLRDKYPLAYNAFEEELEQSEQQQDLILVLSASLQTQGTEPTDSRLIGCTNRYQGSGVATSQSQMVAVGRGVGSRYVDEMNTYVALFRGINVGGKNVLPMNELVSMLENIGLQNVETYIQSGNVVFQSEETNASLIADTIGAVIRKSRSFEPQVLMLEAEEIEKAVRSNPFPEAESEPKTLHLYFLSSEPRSPNLDALESIKSDSERFVLKDGVFYLHAPYGIGRSKLAANVEKILGVSMTGRNWRTVCKIMEMVH